MYLCELCFFIVSVMCILASSVSYVFETYSLFAIRVFVINVSLFYSRVVFLYSVCNAYLRELFFLILPAKRMVANRVS